MKNRILLLIIVTVLLGCSKKISLPTVEESLRVKLEQYLKHNYTTPEEYVISKFNDHDIVFIGEFHRIKQNVELIQHLIPMLYKNGIYILGTEFGRREDQHLIDSLLNSARYDENLARRIIFNQFVHWGYREYVDIYRAAWQLNQSISEQGRKFRILGLNDSPDWSIIRSQKDREDPAIMRKVWRGGGEHLWAKVILDEVVAKGEKALIYCGIHHAFTEYKQPIFDEQKKMFIRFEEGRMGNFVYNKIGKRAITIYMHAVWPSCRGYSKPNVYPTDGIIDAVMAGMEPKYQRVGFDTRGTPFGKLPGETSIYKHGYVDFSLEKFCDGYIYQMPLSKYEGVTPIKGFINNENIDRARAQSPNPWFRNATIEDFYDASRQSADIKKRFARFW